eukprot:GHVT01104666.1.p2 GENE.GHVT01104666.1~~GHVT01104666.1.p2  ORF type:complete len:170 (+),score=10.10 GHVT01104666.1:464-973(+)
MKDICHLSDLLQTNLSMPYSPDAEEAYKKFFPYAAVDCEFNLSPNPNLVYLGNEDYRKRVVLDFLGSGQALFSNDQVKFLGQLPKLIFNETDNIDHEMPPLQTKGVPNASRGAIVGTLRIGQLGFLHKPAANGNPVKNNIFLVISTISVPLTACYHLKNFDHLLKVAKK